MKIEKRDVLDIVNSSVLALILSCVYILFLTLIITFTNIKDSMIMPLNIFGKIISILIASILGIKSMRKGFLKGLLIGLIFSTLTYLIYSFVNKNFSLTIYTLYDILACIVSSIISGILVVNLKKPKIA